MNRQLTAVIEREGNGYVSLCPGLDIASQGDGVDEARNNLREAIELFFETALPEECRERVQRTKSTPSPFPDSCALHAELPGNLPSYKFESASDI